MISDKHAAIDFFGIVDVMFFTTESTEVHGKSIYCDYNDNVKKINIMVQYKIDPCSSTIVPWKKTNALLEKFSIDG